MDSQISKQKKVYQKDLVYEGRKIRIARKKKGLTLTELQDLTGVKILTLSFYERNKKKHTERTIKKIAVALGVSPDDFLKDEILRKRKKEKY